MPLALAPMWPRLLFTCVATLFAHRVTASLVVRRIARESAALHLANSGTTSEQQETRDITPEEIERAANATFRIQWVGLRTSDTPQPKSPLESGANQCLTASSSDKANGISLTWASCEDPRVNACAETTKSAARAQLFHLSLTGTLRSVDTDLCVRRTLCDGDRYYYALGDCDSDLATIFKANKLIASSLDHIEGMGLPVQAVAKDMCQMCGPYILAARCFGLRRSSTAPGCRQDWKASPGWTQRPSSYIGEWERDGSSSHPVQEFFDNVYDDLKRDGVLGASLSGLGRTDDDGICGSYVTDGPDISSIFYLLRTS